MNAFLIIADLSQRLAEILGDAIQTFIRSDAYNDMRHQAIPLEYGSKCRA